MLPFFPRKCLWCGSHRQIVLHAAAGIATSKKHLHERTIFNKYFPEDIIIDQNFGGNATVIICEMVLKCKMNSLEQDELFESFIYFDFWRQGFGPPRQQIVKNSTFLLRGKDLGYNNCDVIIFSKGAKINTTFLLCLLVFKNSVTHSTKIDLFSCRDKIGKKVFNFLVKKKVSIFLKGGTWLF